MARFFIAIISFILWRVLRLAKGIALVGLLLMGFSHSHIYPPQREKLVMEVLLPFGQEMFVGGVITAIIFWSLKRYFKTYHADAQPSRVWEEIADLAEKHEARQTVAAAPTVAPVLAPQLQQAMTFGKRR